MTPELTLTGPCPACGHWRVTLATCRCGHVAQVHDIGGSGKRTHCMVGAGLPGGCACRKYEPGETP